MINKPELSAALEAYVSEDEREEGFRRRMLELVQQDDPFHRTNFQPGHFTASAFVLSPDRKSLLLIFHSKFKLWLQPGGHVDPEDASIESAAAREVTEETGLRGFSRHKATAILDVDIHKIPARKEEPDHEHFDVRMFFVADNWEIEAGSDAEGAKWVSLDPSASEGIDAVESDESVRRAVRKIRRILASEPA